MLYIFFYTRQIRHVEELCSIIEPGFEMKQLEEFYRDYDVLINGNFKDKEKENSYHTIICSNLTMCETSCDIFNDGKYVIGTKFWSY